MPGTPDAAARSGPAAAPAAGSWPSFPLAFVLVALPLLAAVGVWQLG